MVQRTAVLAAALVAAALPELFEAPVDNVLLPVLDDDPDVAVAVTEANLSPPAVILLR